jgi:tetratricopeptide (TPR) repeat protein
MDALLPSDKLALKRLDKTTKRINHSGILLVGVDTQHLADEFFQYLQKEHSLQNFETHEKLLSNLVYSESFLNDSFYLKSIAFQVLEREMIDNLQFQRDFISEKELKILIILSNENLEYLKENAGDLFSTVKFSYSFIDHSVKHEVLINNDSAFNKALENYESYLKLEIKHNNIMYDLLITLGMEAYWISKFDISLSYFEKSLNYTDNKKEKSVNSYRLMGLMYFNMGDYKKALKYQLKALQLVKKSKVKQDISILLTEYSDTHLYLSNFEVALKNINEALEIQRKNKDKQGIAHSLGITGNIYRKKGDLNQALHYQKQSLSLEESLNNQSDIAVVLGNIGCLYLDLGDLDLAFKYHQKSLAIEEKIGNKHGLISSLGSLGRIYQELGDLKIALTYQKKSLLIAREIQEKTLVINALGSIANLSQELGDLKNLQQYYEEILVLSKEITYKSGIAGSLGNLANLYKDQGDIQKAFDYQKKSLVLQKEIGNISGIIASLNNLGIYYKSIGNFNEAYTYCNKSLKIARKHKLFLLEALNFYTIAGINKKEKNFIDAKKNYLLSKHLYEAMNLPLQVEEIESAIESLNL